MGQSPACPAVSSRDPAPRPASTAARGPGAPSAPGPSQGVVVRLPLHALDAVPAGPRSRGARARTAARVHRHPPVDPPGGVGPHRPGPPRCAPTPRSAAGRGTGRTPSTRTRTRPGAPPPGRPDPGAPPHGVDHGAQRVAAGPAPHRRGGQQGLEQRPPGIGRVMAGGCVYTRHPRPSPVSRFDFTPPVIPRGPRPARHAAPTRLTQHALGGWGARGGRRPALRRRDPGPRSRGRGGAEAASSPRRKPAAGPRPTLKSC
mgnify:CR=1 FL=1